MLDFALIYVGTHNVYYVKYSGNVQTQAGQGTLRPCCKTLTSSLLLNPDYFNYKQHIKAIASALPALHGRFDCYGHKKTRRNGRVFYFLSSSGFIGVWMHRPM
ncbi:hypothetical protein [Enterobacter mori]|uniref:hypothetical protein n=1 Tax=Enterobacter mori TaxID=539813 RepID=UPI001B8B28E4|nr:hypothetical protein [Enterobacter mori]MBS3046034.1 hypothetical protein [Enterobacter mori]